MTKMTAKFNGVCSICGRDLYVGQMIVFAGKCDARCLACQPVNDPAVRPENVVVNGGIHRGAWVKVVAGRKAPIGVHGLIIWTGTSKWGDRVGITTKNNGVIWTAAKNVSRLSGKEMGDLRIREEMYDVAECYNDSRKIYRTVAL